MASGDHGGKESILRETQRQIGQRMAEKVDSKIVAELEKAGNTGEGFLASAANETMNIREINAARTKVFGDRMNEAAAIIMHSNDYVNLMNDTTAGFLKADATMPLWGTKAFVGQILGMNVIVNDQCPKDDTVSTAVGNDCYASYIIKPQAYGLVTKQDMIVNYDRDILARQDMIAVTSWFGTQSFHAKFAPDDLRITRMVFDGGIASTSTYAAAPKTRKKLLKNKKFISCRGAETPRFFNEVKMVSDLVDNTIDLLSPTVKQAILQILGWPSATIVAGSMMYNNTVHDYLIINDADAADLINTKVLELQQIQEYSSKMSSTVHLSSVETINFSPNAVKDLKTIRY